MARRGGFRAAMDAVDGIFIGDGVGVGVADGVVASILLRTSTAGISSAPFAILSLFAGDSSESVPGVSGVMYRIAYERARRGRKGRRNGRRLC